MSEVFKTQILMPINKVYWNIVMLTQLHITCDCFLKAELSNCERDCSQAKPKVFLIWTYTQKNAADLCPTGLPESAALPQQQPSAYPLFVNFCSNSNIYTTFICFKTVHLQQGLKLVASQEQDWRVKKGEHCFFGCKLFSTMWFYNYHIGIILIKSVITFIKNKNKVVHSIKGI